MEPKKPADSLFSRHLKSRLSFKHSLIGRFADLMTHWFGTVTFLFINFIVFLVWILWNEGLLGYEIFDPFPYSLLTMAVSLEAIALSVIVLISQNRQGHIADIREKLDFEIDVRSEEEITKMLIMLDEIQHHLGMRRHLKDSDLAEMKARTDIDALREEAESLPDA